jgi:hypothetical protein
MALDERRRSALFQAAAQALGEDHAVTMFELLPPPETELATRADLDRLEERIDLRMDGLEERLLAQTEALRNELLAAFRGELVTAIASQTRVMVITTITAVVGIGGLAVTLSQVL